MEDTTVLITEQNRKKPKNPASRVGSEEYLYARKLYFTAKRTDTNEIVHAYSSSEISKTIRKDYNLNIPDATIRRWYVTPDKDFDKRTWGQEWERRLALGSLKSLNILPKPEHILDAKDNVTNTESSKSPAQQLSDLKEKSLRHDINIAVNIDYLVMLAIKDVQQAYKKNGEKFNDSLWQKLTLLSRFHSGSKERVYNELKDIENMEKQIDRELLYGGNVILKDPSARERVRKFVLSFMNLAYEKGLRDKVFTDNTTKQIDTIEHNHETFNLEDTNEK